MRYYTDFIGGVPTIMGVSDESPHLYFTNSQIHKYTETEHSTSVPFALSFV